MTKSRVSVCVALTLTLLLAIAGESRAELIYGLMTLPMPNGQTQLVTFDSSTPQMVTIIGPTGIGSSPFQSGLEFDGMGNLYLSNTGSSNFLYSVNKLTGSAMLVGGSGLASSYGLGDLAWDPADNRMLAIAARGTLGSSPILYDVNLATGALTSLGSIAAITDGGEVSLAVDADGTIYIHGLATDRWYRVNPNTLAATPLNLLPFGTNFGQGGTIDWGGDGTLYHAAFNSSAFAGQLWTINKANGAATLVGNIGTNLNTDVQITDIAIEPQVNEVPEPASLALWSLLGTAGLAAWRRKRKASAA